MLPEKLTNISEVRRATHKNDRPRATGNMSTVDLRVLTPRETREGTRK